MKKVLLIVAILSLLSLTCIGAGTFLFAKSMEPKKALEQNLKLFADLENVDAYTAEMNSDGQAIFKVTGLGEEEQNNSQDLDSSAKYKIDVKNKKVTLDSSSSEISLDDYKKSGSVLTNKNFWDKVIKHKDLKVESVEEGGKKLWKYTLKDKALNEVLKDNAKTSFETGFNTTSSESQVLKDVTVDFNGVFEIIYTVDQATNLLTSAKYSTSDDIVIKFKVSFPEFEEINADGTATIKNLSESSKISDIDLKDGYSMPTNGLMLLLK